MIVPLLFLTLATQVARPLPAPGPLDNPLKGWCPYTIVGPLHQPYSMVFLYVPWKELEPQEGVFRFEEWEKKEWVTPVAQGKHIVFRVMIDYPGRPTGVPDWLAAKGVPLRRYEEHGGGVAPDYDDPRMVAAMERLIAALGRRYDQNPRVAFVQFGMLGYWGEWHTYPRDDLFASDETQAKVLQAARRAFPNKIVMTRYPQSFGGRQPWIGYFDDSFPDDTDGPEEWKFLPKMRRAGRTENWKVAAIGGEMLPHLAKRWLGEDYALTLKRLKDAHFSWVGPYCPAQEEPPSAEFVRRSQALVRRMGYEFRLTKIASPSSVRRGSVSTVELEGVNDGVAPFYYRWPVRLALIDKKGQVVSTAPADVDIRKWLPGAFRAKLSARFSAPPGTYQIALGIIDPWKGQPAIGFANKLDKVDGWTVLNRVTITR